MTSRRDELTVNDESEWDPLLKNLVPSDARFERVKRALVDDGFCILPSVLSDAECERYIDQIWDFIHDTSSGLVSRLDPTSWYPAKEKEIDPWPSTGFNSFPDMFQSNGAGFLLGEMRELLSERVFEPLYSTRELHSSKEGFTFLRPSPRYDGDSIMVQKKEIWVAGKHQTISKGEHYDQSYLDKGLYTIQSLVALEHQEQDLDGCFLCYPRSFGRVHQHITRDTYRGQFPWVPLTDAEISTLTREFKCPPHLIFLRKGDVLLWRSDLAHAPLPPTKPTPRFRAVAYCSMQPASLTPTHVLQQKLQAYKQRQTGDHRPHLESWHLHKSRHPLHRPYFRTSPPMLTVRQAQLYGLIPCSKAEEDISRQIEQALIRGVRFAPADLPTRPPVVPCSARLEFLTPDDADKMIGHDKYLGGIASPCGAYVYGVPGGATRVMKVCTSDGRIEFIGPSYPGNFKWLRGIEVSSQTINDPQYPSGCCLALPCNHPSILKINPATDEVYAFGQEVFEQCGARNWYYHGGVLALSGWVYTIPANAERVAKVNAATDDVLLIGPTFSGPQKWYGGILGSDGCIYGVPHNHTGVLKINPMNDVVSVLVPEDGSPFPDEKGKWHGGFRSGHKIYCFPNNADRVLVIDCAKDRVYTVGDSRILRSGRHRFEHGDRYKYLGGACTLDGSYGYLFPCDAEQVLRIDCRTDELRLVGPLLLDGENKFQNGFVARDGCIYGIPQRASGVLRIIPPKSIADNDHVDVIDCGADLIGVKDKFEGGVLAGDGCIYCMPLRSKVCVKIVPALKPQQPRAPYDTREGE